MTAVVVVVGPFVQDYTAQPAARYTFTAAMVDHGQVTLDRYEHALGYDRAEWDGRTYSDKAPAQPVLAIPFYALHRAVGGEPATVLRVEENLGLWWVTLWTSVVPLAVLTALMWAAAREVEPASALPAAVSVAGATLLLPISSSLYGHTLAAALAFGSWFVTRRGTLHAGRLVGGGLLAGAAVATEYPVAIAAAVLGGSLFLRVRWRAALWGLAALPPVLAVMAYQAAVFGSPTRTPISTKEAIDQGLVGIGWPDPGNVVRILAGPRGFVPMMPVVLVALAGIWLMLRRDGRSRERLWAAVAAVVFAAFFLIPAGWANPWGGDVPGPRYLLTAVPFLAVPLAVAWRRWPAVARGSAAVGAVMMGLAVVTSHLVGRGDVPVVRYLERLADGDVAATVWTMALGPAGWLLHAATGALAAVAVVHQHRQLAATAAEAEPALQ